MIIVDAIICHVPICVMVYGANSNNPTPFLVPYSIYEKVQVTIFFIQELSISILYIFQTVKIMRPEGNIRGNASRSILTHLIYVNVIIVVLDITILALEYSGLYDVQTVYKGLVYSVKLKIEFSILNRLVGLAQGKFSSSNNYQSQEQSIHLETFNEDRLKRIAMGNDKQAGYKAYITSDRARTDDVGGAGPENSNSIVVATTQVVIKSEVDTSKESAEHSQGNWKDIERGLESVDPELVGNGMGGQNRAISSASSQSELARVKT
jgi:hypothetical protein